LAIADGADSVTGYTHQWRSAPAEFARICRASVDDPSEIREAHAAGYKLFVVRPAGTPKPRGLVQCPASAESGYKTTCSVCMRCGGTDNGRSGDVTIAAHGSTARRFTSSPLQVLR
jgi:hypothetical protein